MSGLDPGRQRVLRRLQRMASSLERDFPVRSTLWNHDVSPWLRRWRWTMGLRLDLSNGTVLYMALDFGGSPTRRLDSWVFWGPVSLQPRSLPLGIGQKRPPLERPSDPLRPSAFCKPLEKIVREMLESGPSEPELDDRRPRPEEIELPDCELALRRQVSAALEAEWLLDGWCPPWEVSQREEFWLGMIEPDWQPVTSGPAVQLVGADYFQHSPLAPKRYGNEWRDFYRSHPERRGLLSLSRLGCSSTGLQAMRVIGRDGEERGLDFLVVWTVPDSQPRWHDLSRPMPKETAREFERQTFARQLTEVSQGAVTLIGWQLQPRLKHSLGSSGAILQVGEVRLHLHWLEARRGLYPEPPVLAMPFSNPQVVWDEIQAILTPS